MMSPVEEAEERFKVYLVIGIVGFFCFVLLIALVAKFTQSSPRKYVNDVENLCENTKLMTRLDLPKRHCGKACSEYVVEFTFYCKRENKEVIFTE